MLPENKICHQQEATRKFHLHAYQPNPILRVSCDLWKLSKHNYYNLIFKGWQMLGAYAAVTSVGMYIYYLNAKMVQREEIEMRSSQNVIFPILIAERDREYLKQLRRNRDEEAKLMANVPGWEVGWDNIYLKGFYLMKLLFFSFSFRWVLGMVNQCSKPCLRIN